MSRDLGLFNSLSPYKMVPETRLSYTKTEGLLGCVDRIRRFNSGERVNPGDIVIEAQRKQAVLEGFGPGDSFFRGRRPVYISDDITEFRLSVLSDFEPVISRIPKFPIPLVFMTILGDLQTQELTLKKEQVRSLFLIGNRMHRLTYMQDGPSTAALTEINVDTCRNHKRMSGPTLTKEQNEQLKLEVIGIPKRIDWLRTFFMYTLLKQPDPDGSFSSASKPLTAKYVFEHQLVPARI